MLLNKFIRFVILFVCIHLHLSAFAITIKTNTVIAITDSILISRVGEHLFPYFEISNEGTHYNYLASNKKLVSELLINKRKITKKFNEIWVLYQFNYTKIEGLKSGIWIKLDANLQLLEEPNLNAVPNFLIHDEPSNFITKHKAKEIASQIFTGKNNTISDPILEYSKKKEKYIYSIANKTIKTIETKKVVELEIIELDVYSGKLLRRYESYNGLIEK